MSAALDHDRQQRPAADHRFAKLTFGTKILIVGPAA
jgi:hypothetical protein